MSNLSANDKVALFELHRFLKELDQETDPALTRYKKARLSMWKFLAGGACNVFLLGLFISGFFWVVGVVLGVVFSIVGFIFVEELNPKDIDEKHVLSALEKIRQLVERNPNLKLMFLKMADHIENKMLDKGQLDTLLAKMEAIRFLKDIQEEDLPSVGKSLTALRASLEPINTVEIAKEDTLPLGRREIMVAKTSKA